MKLLHLFGFIIKKFVTMHGHRNVKFVTGIILWSQRQYNAKVHLVGFIIDEQNYISLFKNHVVHNLISTVFLKREKWFRIFLLRDSELNMLNKCKTRYVCTLTFVFVLFRMYRFMQQPDCEIGRNSGVDSKTEGSRWNVNPAGAQTYDLKPIHT